MNNYQLVSVRKGLRGAEDGMTVSVHKGETGHVVSETEEQIAVFLYSGYTIHFTPEEFDEHFVRVRPV